MHILGQSSILLGSYKKCISTIMTGHQKNNLFVLTALHGGLSGNHQNQFRTIFGPKICIFLRYTLTTPNFWALVDPTQWDHNFPIYWGNSGYLWFSGRRPFNRLGGYYEASNGQNGSIWGQKCSFLAQNQCFGDIVQFFWYHHDRTQKIQLFCADFVTRPALGRPPGLKNSILDPQKDHFGQSGL